MSRITGFFVLYTLLITCGALSTSMGFNVLTWQYWAILIAIGASNVFGFIEGLHK